MKEDSIKSFKHAFSNFLKEQHLDHTYKQKQIIANWDKVMGKTISSRTSSLYFKEKTLFIKVTSAPLKHEMQMTKAEIIKLIEKEIGKGEVREVRFL